MDMLRKIVSLDPLYNDIVQSDTISEAPNSTATPTPDLDGAVPRSVRLAYAIVMTLLGVIICSGNGLFIAAYIKSHKQSTLRTHATFFLVQLAVADFLVGLSMPYHIATFWISQLEHQMVTCALRYLTIIFPLSASLGCLLLACTDRCIAVRAPLKYLSIVTNQKVYIASGIAWTSSFFVGVVLAMVLHKEWNISHVGLTCDLIVRFKWAYFGAVLLPLLLLITIAITFINAFTMFTVSQHSRNRRRLFGCATSEMPDPSFSSQNIRVLVTGLIVCAIFYLCWLPFFLILTVQIYGFRMEDKSLGRARTIATFPAISNSFMNFFVYTWRLPLLRGFIKNIFHVRRKSAESAKSTSTSNQTAEAVENTHL